MKDTDKTTFILIRHGETVANRENIFRGRMDFPLNENGISQAKALAKELSQFNIDVIYSSPLSRSLKTAEIIGSTCSTIDIHADEGLINISLGSWEGQPKNEIAKKFPDMYYLWTTEPERLKIPGAESIDDVQKKAVETIKKLCANNKGRTIGVVSHRAVLKPMLAGLLDIRPPYFWKIHLDNASYSIVTYTPARGWTLILSNQTKHLSQFVVEEE